MSTSGPYPALPPEAADLLRALDAPGRLVRHLIVVHAVAVALTNRLRAHWPALTVDWASVHLGAALHDIGKVAAPEELHGPGSRHEALGPASLVAAGLPEVARFARTHGSWAQEPVALEDLLVALADQVWRGARPSRLEEAVAARLAVAVGEPTWATWLEVDEMLNEIAEGATARLAWASSADA